MQAETAACVPFPLPLPPPIWGPLAEYDERSTREFYSYHHPFQVLSPRKPVWVDLHDPVSVANHAPLASPDKALTAFCQLVAVRLRVRRALLFFFDDRYGYVLAEATQSLSLQRDSTHDPDDGLWLGHAIIPKGFSVCEHTVNLPASNNGSNNAAPSASRVHIINDMQRDNRFERRPYVTGGPLARFYAGAPITTPRGVNIGALCALDGKPRMGLEDGEIDFLTDMAATVMDHLEALRARAEYKRGMEMIAGLNAFVQGKPSNTATTAKPAATATAASSSTTSNVSSATSSSMSSSSDSSSVSTVPTTVSSASTITPPTYFEHPLDDPVISTTLPHGTKSGDTVEPALIGEEISTLPGMVAELEDRVATPEPELPELTTPMPPPIAPVNTPSDGTSPPTNDPFASAATIVQKALDLDGVLFLDASVSTFGGLVGEPRRVSTDGFDSSDSVSEDIDAEDNNSQPSMTNVDTQATERGTCTLLAAAYANNASTKHGLISQRSLRDLCRRYPRGKIWRFNSADDEGTSSSEDEAMSNSTISRSSSVSEAGSILSKRQRWQRRRRRHHAELARLIPGVRCLALMPVRDNAADNWRAGAVLYTLSPQRTFSPEGELNFMAAFGNTLIAELARTESHAALQAKSAFMSSLSHELRTPLHGILGTVEQLYEETSPSVAAKMVKQIEICGRTLLDFINHLLDFSKVSRGEGDFNPYATATQTPNFVDEDGNAHYGKRSAINSSLPTKLTALDIITAETVEACILSHRSTLNTQQLRNLAVSTTLHITPARQVNWALQIAEGAWKRICMNVVSNALKYTESGYISITLKQEPARPGLARPTAVFCVEDSGRGMSKDYMLRSLFRPFTQEDAFAPGAGLGMSLVAQLVRSMDGKVDVQSNLGTGTTVTVMVPLTLVNVEAGKSDSVSRSVPTVPNDATALLLGDWSSGGDTPTAKGRVLVCTVVQSKLEELTVTILRRKSTRPATFAAVLEEDLISISDGTMRYKATGGHADTLSLTSMPIMVICRTHVSARRLERNYGQGPNCISFVTEPYSSAQIAVAVSACTRPVKEPTSNGVTHDQTTTRPLLFRVPSSPPPQQDSFVRPNSTDPAARESTDAYSSNWKQTTEQNSNYQSTTSNANPHPSLSEDNKPPGTRDRSAVKTGDGTLTLILVDDNSINLQLLSTFCKRKGHRSFTATDGQQAVKQYQNAVLAQMEDDVSFRYTIQGDQIRRAHDRPQVILLDINMPVMDGFEAAQAIREFEKKTGVAPVLIIAMTGLSSSEARQHAFASGIDLFLSKPVKLKELTEVLANRFGGGAT